MLRLFSHIKRNDQVKSFIGATEEYLKYLGYTDHGFRHVSIVAQRARYLARRLKFGEKIEDLVASASYCHDMGNYLGRTEHHYWGALLFNQIFLNDPILNMQDLIVISQAIADHDKIENKLIHPVSALLVIADKSDVSRDRINKEYLDLSDIHTRVNYYVLKSELKVFRKERKIRLVLEVDDALSEMDYFEIFVDRMNYCRLASEFLSYKFELKLNNIILD